MKKINIDWAQVGIICGSIALTITKTLYDAKKFDKNLNNFFNNQLESKVLDIVKKSEGEK